MKTREHRKGYLGLLAGLTLALSGCIRPGLDGSKLIQMYQKAMAKQAPQKRAGETGLDSLMPLTDAPALKTAKDAATGKTMVLLSLDEAIQRGVANNQHIKVISFDPAIAREQVVQAAAEFDWIIRGGYMYDKADRMTDTSFLANTEHFSTWGTTNEGRGSTTGIGKKTITGAEVLLDWGWTRSWSQQAFRDLPLRYASETGMQISQPLLRDGWPEFNLARIRIARLTHRLALSQFRQRTLGDTGQSLDQFRLGVEEIIAEIVSAYWDLVLAHRRVAILESLLKRTQETLERIRKRKDVDATAVQIKQAEAAVEDRNAELIEARKTIHDARDVLGRLLADKQVNVIPTDEIRQTTEPITTKVHVDPTDQLIAALRDNPLMEQARLRIQIAGQQIKIAKNQLLPRLDLTASTRFQGLTGSPSGTRSALNSGDFASYNVGISLEYPLGNRAAKALMRARRYERLQAITELQDLADRVAIRVNERCRLIDTSYARIVAYKAAVKAYRAQLQALEDIEKFRGRLTPEFLQTKLNAQERLARAEIAEVTATIQYNVALTDLARATGSLLRRYHVMIEGTLEPADIKALQARLLQKKDKPEKK